MRHDEPRRRTKLAPTIEPGARRFNWDGVDRPGAGPKPAHDTRDCAARAGIVHGGAMVARWRSHARA
ncbi:hypothetical protein SALB1_0489 [Salinisphaera sp. LB1]|nr:hypothetical protein SALB1_0489 [Salinisphaera sp. LB1]